MLCCICAACVICVACVRMSVCIHLYVCVLLPVAKNVFGILLWHIKFHLCDGYFDIERFKQRLLQASYGHDDVWHV